MNEMAMNEMAMLLTPAVPDLRGTRHCCNPKCGRQIYCDYVKLSSENLGSVLLCGECWTTRIDTLPEAAHAAAVAAIMSTTFGPPTRLL